MHCARFSPKVPDPSQGKQIVFETFPVGKLCGQRFRNDIGFDGTDMTYDFKVIKISGQVIWKYQAPSDVNARNAKLKVKRLHSTPSEETVFGELKLAEYDQNCSPDANGLIKQSFDFIADAEEFWQKGDKGMFVSDHVALGCFCR